MAKIVKRAGIKSTPAARAAEYDTHLLGREIIVYKGEITGWGIITGGWHEGEASGPVVKFNDGQTCKVRTS